MSDNSSDLGLSKGSVTRKLSKIEKKISRGDLSKRERRLLQNRKSALKCRIKKQDQLERLKGIVDRLSGENRSLKEKVSSTFNPLGCFCNWIRLITSTFFLIFNIVHLLNYLFKYRSPLSTLCWHARMRKTKASTKSTASCNFNRRSFWLVISLKMESTSRIFQGNLEIKLPKMPSTVLLKINRVNLWLNLPPTSRSQAEEKLSKVTTRSPAKSNNIFWLWKKTS